MQNKHSGCMDVGQKFNERTTVTYLQLSEPDYALHISKTKRVC